MGFDKQKKLFLATKKGDIDTVKLLIEKKGALVSEIDVDNQNQTLAHVAARNGNLELFKYIVEKNSTLINTRDLSYHSAVRVAVEHGAKDILKYLVENHGIRVAEMNLLHFKSTAIHSAVEFGHLSVLKYFVDEENGDINVTDRNGRPPIFLAVKHRRPDIISYLVDQKQANLTINDYYGENVLYMTVRTGNLTLMKYFLDDENVTIDINHGNYLGETLVHYAVFLNRFNILQYLVEEKNADLNIPEKKYGMTSLHCAAIRNHYDFCQYLVQHGANTQLKDKSGQTPAEMATNAYLVEYFKNISIPVTRRRRDQPSQQYSMSSPSTVFHERPRLKVNADSSVALNLYSEDEVGSTILQSFLTITDMIFGVFKGSSYRKQVRNLVFPTPQTSLLSKMDLAAVDVVSQGDKVYG